MKKLNICLIFTMILGSLLIAANSILNGNLNRLIPKTLILPIILIPTIFKNTKFELNDFNLFIFYIFIFISHFLGSIVNLYKYIWWYDIFAHGISGIFSYMVSIFILKKLNMYNRNNILFNFLFSFGIVFMVAGSWEIMEFITDIVLHTNLQHNLDTGVIDTMEDIIIAIIGGIVAFVISLTKKLLNIS